MSHILQEYAKSCGTKIGKPYNNPQYYPIPFDKYIVIHATSEAESKNYDYYDDVVEIILPFLEKNNINIVQIGGEKDRPIRHCYNALGITKRQIQYIIKNSELVLCGDSYSSHFASGLDKKIVCLYSSFYKENSLPYWSNNKDIKLLEPDRKNKKPCFFSNENPKTINSINPEEISKSILDLLGINEDTHFKTLFVGAKYPQSVVEIVPNFLNRFNIKNKLLNIRLDYGGNLDLLPSWLVGNKSNLIINKEIDVSKIIEYKQFIDNVFFDITDIDYKNISQYLKNLSVSGFKITLISRNKEKIQDQRFILFDFNVFLVDNISIKDDQNFYENTNVKTNKIILSNGKEYISKEHLTRDLSIKENISPLKTQDFWNDSEHMLIFSTKND